jgi:hypothetical protein
MRFARQNLHCTARARPSIRLSFVLRVLISLEKSGQTQTLLFYA